MHAAFSRWLRELVEDGPRLRELLEDVDVRAPRERGPYRCPCCRFLTLEERGGHDICPVCFWQDDGHDEAGKDRIRGGPNESLSLSQARANFQRFGASSERRLALVRPPLPEEL